MEIGPRRTCFYSFLDTKYFWQSHPFTFIEEELGSIIFFCKVKDGITRSLYNRLLSSPGKSTKVRVTVEGPYGEPTPARYADSAVFLAGGNGIPGIYSRLSMPHKAVVLARRRINSNWFGLLGMEIIVLVLSRIG